MTNPIKVLFYRSAFKAGIAWRTYLRLRQFYFRYLRWRRKAVTEK